MHSRSSAFSIVALFTLTIFSACTKFDTTDLGADLIPVVDNINTFADTLDVVATQGAFLQDTTRLGVSELHVIGNINNDPLFGKTSANIYLEFKPTFFPYYWGVAKDTINSTLNPKTGFDSVVLCLSYKGFYGDSTKPQTFKVYEIDKLNPNFKYDSIYNINHQPNLDPVLLGQTTFTPSNLNNYTVFKNRIDSTNYQIRIKLDDAFLNKLITLDSSDNGGLHSDSLYKSIFKGLAIVAEGNATSAGLCYINITDAQTRMEVHFRRKKEGSTATTVDTTFNSFFVSSFTSTNLTKSATANYIHRDYTGSEILAGGSNQSIYIQTAPGTFANLRIPELSTFPNSVIHLAELIVEGNENINLTYPAPDFLYLDAKDTGTAVRYQPIPLDLNPNSFYDPTSTGATVYPSAGIDFNHFGGPKLSKFDQSGNPINYYRFNIGRYVQNVVTNGALNYQLRLYAPYNIYYNTYGIPFSNRLAFGRIKLGDGNNATHKLRLRVVYSKI